MAIPNLISHVSAIFEQQLAEALKGQLVIPVDTVVEDGAILRLRNGAYTRLWHCPLLEDHTMPLSGPLAIPLTGPLNALPSWEELLYPASAYLADQVIKKAAGGPIVSALLLLPAEGLGVDAIISSTKSLFAFRTMLSADYNALSFELTFDAIFGDISIRR